jgi:hypothetical protein
MLPVGLPFARRGGRFICRTAGSIGQCANSRTHQFIVIAHARSGSG